MATHSASASVTTLRTARGSCAVLLTCCAISLFATACERATAGDDDTLAIQRHRDAGLSSGNSVATRHGADAGDAVSDDTGKVKDDDRGSAADSGASAGAMAASAAGSGGAGGAGAGGAGGSSARPANDGNGLSDAEEPSRPVLFWLEVTSNRVWRANPDGTAKQMLATDQGISTPDGITVDLDGGYIYWTNMGSLTGGSNRGTLQRMKVDGGPVETVVPIGTTNTPKQISIDAKGHKLYWSDREGAKVWRANLDGSGAEVLVSGHEMIQLVGMALDTDREQFYFSDRLSGKIYRAGFDIPPGETAENRTDLEALFEFSVAAMPIDLDLDLKERDIYWTDRLRGTVLRAKMDIPAGQTPETRADVETLALLADTIGISLDRVQKQLYFTQLSGEVWRANFDGSQRKLVTTSDSASGVSVARLPE